MKLKKMNFVEKTINCLLNVLIFIFAIILLISIYTSVQTKILGNDYTDFFGYSMFEVQTGSMADTINAGDWIIVKLTKNIKLKDVVTYKLDNEFITHRVIEVYKSTYITKGDANNAKDEPVDQNQVVGKVIKVLANFGIIRKTLFNPSVLITLIITLFLFDFAIKKNKTEGTRKTTKFNREENIYAIFNIIIKKACVLFNHIIKFIAKNIGKISDNIKKFINNKTLKGTAENTKRIGKNDNTLKTENNDLEIYQNNSDERKKLVSKVETEDYYTDTDDLNKTSFFRVIPVDATEVDDKFKTAPTKAEIEEYYTDTDELDKTSLFRMIPVDATEVNDTLLEIAESKIKETEQNNKDSEKVRTLEPKVEIKEDESRVSDSDTLTNINLELLKSIKDNNKGENIIDTVMIIKKEELSELINILIENHKNYPKAATIKEMFITTYIDAKYHNCYDVKNSEHSNKNSIPKIERAIKEIALASELLNNYPGSDNKYTDILDIYANTFILIANLEAARDSITDLKVKKEFYKKEIKKYFKDWNDDRIQYVINEIMKIQEVYKDTLEYYLKKLDTNMFNLNFNKISNRKDMYGLELEHNITFSKVYSDYIIDKTYTEGIVAEDKMSVLLTLLSVQLIKDMNSSNFNKKYILYVPESLYAKEKKFEKLLRMIEDKYAKDSVIILIKLKNLLSNKRIVKKVRKMGYKFALVFDEHSVIREKNRGDMYIFDYIFVDKKAVNMENIISFIPEELLDKIIDEDIANKVGDFGGEQE